MIRCLFRALTVFAFFIIASEARSQATCKVLIAPGTHEWVDVNSRDTTNCSISPDLTRYCDSLVLRRSNNILLQSKTINGKTVNTRAYLKFDFSMFKDMKCEVVSANLHLNFLDNATDSHTVGADILVKRVVEDWGEDTLTWKTPPGAASSRRPLTTVAKEKQIFGPSTKDADMVFEIGRLLQPWIIDPETNFGIELSLLNEIPGSTLNFASSDHPNASLRPYIEVEIRNCADAQASAGSPITICEGETVTFSGTGGFNGFWTQGATIYSKGADTAATLNTTTTFTFNTSIGSCSSTDDLTITVDQFPSVSASVDNSTLCFGNKTALTATSPDATTYSWTPTNGIETPGASTTGVTPEVGELTTEVIRYYVTAGNGTQCFKVDSVDITVNPQTPADAGEDREICFGKDIELSASGGTGYTWSTRDAGDLATLSDPNIAKPTAQPGRTLEYFVEVSNGFCPVTDSVTITVNPLPDASAGGDRTFCFEDTVFFSTTPGYAFYQWSSTDASTKFSDVLAHNPFIPEIQGSQQVSLLVRDSKGCEQTDNAVLTINPNPRFIFISDTDTIVEDTTCTSKLLQLTVDPEGIGTEGNYTYEWLKTEGLNDPSIFNPQLVLNNDTPEVYYPIKMTDNSTGCFMIDSLKIVVLDFVLATVSSNQEICAGDQVRILADSSRDFPGRLYEWIDDTSFVTSGVGPSQLVRPEETTTYQVIIRDIAACGADTLETTVSVLPLPVVNAGIDTIICKGDAALLRARGGDTYTWFENGRKRDATTDTLRIVPLAEFNVYTVSTVKDGCEGSQDTVLVKASGEDFLLDGITQVICDIQLLIPNVFGPNVIKLSYIDALRSTANLDPLPVDFNHYFSVSEYRPGTIKTYSVKIYDRFGAKIFESFSLDNRWDGRGPDGDYVPDGSYFYAIKAFGIDGEEKDYSGIVYFTLDSPVRE